MFASPLKPYKRRRLLDATGPIQANKENQAVPRAGSLYALDSD